MEQNQIATQQGPPPTQPVMQTPQNQPANRLFLVGGIVLVISLLLIGLAVLAFGRLGEKSTTSTVTETNPEVVLPPPSLAPISESEYKTQATTLSGYFKQVSPINFKEEFMAGIPAVASTAYDQYLGAGDESAKLESARNFYDYLAGSSAKSDPSFIKFLADVKADLEKTLGKPLF